MFKIIYLPEAIYVYGDPAGGIFSSPIPVVYKTKEKALKSLQKNNIIRVIFVPIAMYGGLRMYRKPLKNEWPYETVPKHLFEVVEV